MSLKKKNFPHLLTRQEINALPGQEVKEKRTASSKTYALGNGLYQAVLYPEPVHFRNSDGDWEDIDHSLQRDGNVLMDQSGDLSVQLAPGGSVTLEKDHFRLSWEMVGAAPVFPEAENQAVPYPRHKKEKRHENRVLYHHVFPDVDFICHLLPNAFKDTLIFHSPEALRTVDFALHAPGMELEMEVTGDVIAKAKDRIIFRLPKPAVVDENGERMENTASAQLLPATDDRWILRYQVDPEFAQTASFPLLLDPVVKTERTTSSMQMAYTSSKQPAATHPVTGYSTYVAYNDYSYGKTDTFLKFNSDALPAIDSSYYVTGAVLTMYATAANNNVPVYLKEVLGNWSSTSITYNNRPSVSSKALEFCASKNASGASFDYDITNLVRKWYAGANYGVMLESLTGNLVSLGGAGATYQRPFVTINYISLAGLESYLSQESHSCGRAGTAHVGLFNGNLVVSQQETSMNGNLLPISVARYYNSCYYNVNPFGVGNGWKLSTQQTLHKETIDSTTYYVYMDGDGTRHHFKQVSGKWNDLSGLNLTLTISGSTATITDKGDNKMVFDLPTAEFANNYNNVKMIKSVSDACSNTASFTWSTRVPTKATDGAGRATTFTASSGNVTAITAPGMAAVSHTYSSGKLTKVTHEDGNASSYTYNSTGLLNKISNFDGTSLQIDYTTSAPYRVTKVTYLADNVAYAGRRYDYGNCRTTVIDLYPNSSGTLVDGKKLHYYFNDAGNMISVSDELGYGCFSGYSSEMPVNHPEYVSQMQKAVTNYLKNHRFLTADSTWTKDLMDGTGEAGYDSTNIFIGGRAYRLKKTSSSGRISTYQTVTLKKGSTYTFSCQYITSGSAKVQLRAEYKNSSGTTQYAESLTEASTDRWNRAYVSFTVPSNSSSTSVTVRIMAAGGAGTVWADAAQLEDGPVPNRYNLLENGSFTMNSSGNPSYWTAGSENGSTDGVYTSSEVARPTELGGNILRIYGATNTYREFKQEFSCMGSRGDSYVAGGWSMSFTRPRNDDLPCNYEMEICARPTAAEAGVSEGTVVQFRTVNRVLWSEEWSGWNFAAVPVVIPFNYTSILVRILYRNGLNYAEFSNLFLHKEEFGKTYAYDANGNVTSVRNMASLMSQSTYDSFNNLLTYKQPGRSQTYTQTWGSTDAEKKKHLLRSSTSPLSIVQEYTYDSKGNPTAALTRNSASSAIIRTTTAYTSNKNYVASQTDARGKTVTTAIDSNKGTVTSVTDPNGQKVSYTYDTNRRVTAVTTTADSKTYRNQYTYTEDKLASVSHNTTADGTCDVTYTFGYDAQNRPTTVKVGSQTLSTNVYNTTKGSLLYGTLTRSEFGNGGKVVNTYDNFKRITGVRFDSDTADRYKYEYGANGQVAKVTDTTLNRTAVSEYDGASRPMRITHMEGANHLYTGQVWYDEYNNLKTFREQVGTGKTAFRTDFTYDVENKPTLMTYGDTNNKVAYTYDTLGRTNKKTLTVGGKAYATTYSYVAGSNGTGNTTGLISSMSQTGETCSYTYDNVGNITAVTRNGVKTTYVYDKLGQLTRVNDPSDTTSGSTGTTWTYEYDRGGNILNKKRYAYTTGTVGTVKQTITYTYDTTWKDKLAKYNGTAITYDAIGNPLTDGTWTYTWEKGRQLKRMSKSGTTATFLYNADGLRIRKTVGSTVTNYTLHGKNIVHMTQGSNTLHFWYDAQNRPAIVQFNGTKYGYIHNLQGDVIGLIDTSGNEVVKYVYDAWGKILSTTGSLASTLGSIQPFRYRSYVYDQETGLYYLRSRYYNSAWGRFANSDKYLNLKKEDEIEGGANLYCYCLNNFVNLMDNDGNLPQKGMVTAYGISSEADLLYALAIVQGMCYDGYGNEAEFITYVGVSPTGQEEHYTAGIGGVGISVSNVSISVSADTVYDFAGKGCYIGGSFEFIISFGVDAIILGKYLPEVRSDTQVDGFQTSYGFGLGLNWFHEGNCFTVIKVTKKEGIAVPKKEQVWEY